MFQEFLASADARRQYWRMKKEGYWEMRRAGPNAGHRALARLEAAGRLVAVITQNIDGLHQDAGSRRVLQLHGTNRSVICLKCEAQYDPDAIQARLEAGEEIPLCDRCGGLLKPATVSFGQQLPQSLLSEAFNLSMKTDLMLAIGSSAGGGAGRFAALAGEAERRPAGDHQRNGDTAGFGRGRRAPGAHRRVPRRSRPAPRPRPPRSGLIKPKATQSNAQVF